MIVSIWSVKVSPEINKHFFKTISSWEKCPLAACATTPRIRGLRCSTGLSPHRTRSPRKWPSRRRPTTTTTESANQPNRKSIRLNRNSLRFRLRLRKLRTLPRTSWTRAGRPSKVRPRQTSQRGASCRNLFSWKLRGNVHLKIVKEICFETTVRKISNFKCHGR